jgi:SAM-dependent methyltransferase
MTNDFDSHWEKNSLKEIAQTKLQEARKFLAPCRDFSAESSKTRILDAGCGDGVHLKILTEEDLFHEEPTIVGMDISRKAVVLAQKRVGQQNPVVQGDVVSIPFTDNSFDIVFSFGVLAYSTSPHLAFAELCRVVRPGGFIGVWLYPDQGGASGLLFRFVRWLCAISGNLGSKIIANMIVPFLPLLPTRSKISLANASWQQCCEIVLVNIAPKQLFFPIPEEVEGWFRHHGIKITHRDAEAPITLWGCKCL